jgi:hypothetical protein
MSKNNDEGWLLAGLLLLCVVAMAGPIAVADKVKERDSWFMRAFVWLFIRSFWFGLGALTVYLCMKP